MVIFFGSIYIYIYQNGRHFFRDCNSSNVKHHAIYRRCWGPNELKELGGDRFQQAHVLGASHRQAIETVVPDDFRNGTEGLAELAENVLTDVVLLDAHVHEAFGAPGRM